MHLNVHPEAVNARVVRLDLHVLYSSAKKTGSERCHAPFARGYAWHSTLPLTWRWPGARCGIEPELYALATLVNAAVFVLLLILYLLLRTGLVRLGVPEE